MAEMFYTADVLYPEWHEGDDTKKYVQQVSDYLFLLREGLGYTLNNLGMKNFNPEQINVLGEVIREPVQIQITDQEGRLAEVSTTLDGVSSTVSAIDGNYVSLSSATQTTSGFEFTVMDGDDDAAVVMDSSGLTVNNGAIAIKNKYGDEVLSADTDGNLTLTGTIEGSAIYGSEIWTCQQQDVGTASTIFVGTVNDVPVIATMGNGRSNGFRAEGTPSRPYYGLSVVSADGSSTVDYMTYYDNNTQSVISRVNNGFAFIGQTQNHVGFVYYDRANAIERSINATDTGITLRGDINGNRHIAVNDDGITLSVSNTPRTSIDIVLPNNYYPLGAIGIDAPYVGIGTSTGEVRLQGYIYANGTLISQP